MEEETFSNIDLSECIYSFQYEYVVEEDMAIVYAILIYNENGQISRVYWYHNRIYVDFSASCMCL